MKSAWRRETVVLLVLCVLVAVLGAAVIALGITADGIYRDLQVRIAEVKDTEEGTLSSVRIELMSLRSQVGEDSQAKDELNGRLSDSLEKLQDIYFDLMKKNDGLQAVWADPSTGRKAYLSFDDGPSEQTPLVLDILKKEKIKASFFVNGRPQYAAVYKRIVADGHQIGNHTYSHDFESIYASVPAFMADVEKLEALLGGIGVPLTKIYRFPGGAKNSYALRLGGPDLTAKISAAMADRGYRFFEWNVTGEDTERTASGAMPAADQVARAVLNEARNKRVAVILLHDGPGHASTAIALPRIISGLRSMGFSFQQLP